MRIISQIESGPCEGCDACLASGRPPHTCEPRELDGMLRCDEGEPRLVLDADERAGIWIEHPGGRMVRIDLHALAAHVEVRLPAPGGVVFSPSGTEVVCRYAMPPADLDASGGKLPVRDVADSPCGHVGPCLAGAPSTGRKMICVYLADGTKVVVRRDATTKGRAWLEVVPQVQVRAADADGNRCTRETPWSSECGLALPCPYHDAKEVR